MGAGPVAMIWASLAAPRLSPVAGQGVGELAHVDAVERLGAAGGGAQRAVVEPGREVEEGAGGRGDRDAVVAGAVVEVEAGVRWMRRPGCRRADGPTTVTSG